MITDNKKVQGYRNWATWNVNLWFNNDQLLYNFMIKAKSANELKAIFNSEIDLFKDFKGKLKEHENIDWVEVYNMNQDH